MRTHKVVIILVNYNGFQDTLECLKSIKISNVFLPFVVIVDNRSIDAKQLEQLHSLYKNLHIIYNSENLGFGRANNIGIQWAQNNIDFEYLLLLNNDTLIESNTIEELIKPFTTDKAIGITSAKTFYENNREIIWYGGGDINYKRGWPKISDFNTKPSLGGANKSRCVTFVSGCTMMFSKKSISEIEGFDNDLFMYCEDLELCMRVNKLELKMYYNAKSIVYHKVQRSTKNNSDINITGMNAKNPNLEFLFYNMKTNQYNIMKKHLKGLNKFNFFIFYWSEFLFKIISFLRAGRNDMIKVGLRVIKKNLK